MKPLCCSRAQTVGSLASVISAGAGGRCAVTFTFGSPVVPPAACELPEPARVECSPLPGRALKRLSPASPRSQASVALLRSVTSGDGLCTALCASDGPSVCRSLIPVASVLWAL